MLPKIMFLDCGGLSTSALEGSWDNHTQWKEALVPAETSNLDHTLTIGKILPNLLQLCLFKQVDLHLELLDSDDQEKRATLTWRVEGLKVSSSQEDCPSHCLPTQET